MAASPETLGLAMLAADPHAWRLDRAAQLAAVSDALADGAATARNLQARFPGRPRENWRANFRCRSRPRTTIQWSARSGDLPNTGRGRHASCFTTADWPRSNTRSRVRWRRDCSAGQRHAMSLSPTNSTIMPKPFDRKRRSRSAISLRCFALATGIGAAALLSWPRSPPAPSRSRCSTCPVTRKCWIRLPLMPSQMIDHAYSPATIGIRAARMAGNSPPTSPTISASAMPSKISHPLSLKSNTTCVKFPPSVEAVTPSKIR